MCDSNTDQVMIRDVVKVRVKRMNLEQTQNTACQTKIQEYFWEN